MPSREDDSSLILDDRGTDIVVKGTLSIAAASLVGTEGGATQDVIALGGGVLDLNVPDIGDGITVGAQFAEGIFTGGHLETYDYIADPANPVVPYVENIDIFEIQEDEAELSEALRQELLKLRIFARDLTPAELVQRRLKGQMLLSEIVVDEAAPISAYEVAVSRISVEAATEAVELAKSIIGEDGEGLEAISASLDSAFEEFVSHNPDGDIPQFASYLTSGSTPASQEAAGYVDQLNQLFESISKIGVTETEANISRRNILSRLQVEGMRGRELIEFFDSYQPSIEETTEIVSL